MKKTLLLTAVIVGAAVTYSACTPKATTSTNTAPTTTVKELEDSAQQLDQETKQDALQEEGSTAVGGSETYSTSTDLGSLEKDLGNMKLEDETFQ